MPLAAGDIAPDPIWGAQNTPKTPVPLAGNYLDDLCRPNKFPGSTPGCVVVFLSNLCWTHANWKLSLQQNYSEELRTYCCKSLFLRWEKLFAKDIYITNVHFKSILEPYKCQIFWDFTRNTIGSLHGRSPNSLLQSLEIPNLRITTYLEISGSYPGSSKIVWFATFWYIKNMSVKFLQM